MWKFEILEVGEIPEAWLVSPGVFHTISQIFAGILGIRLESV